MSNVKSGTGEGGWRFRRELTLGTLVHLVVLLAIVVTGWSNLQRELALIQHDLTRLVRANAKLSEHLEGLTQQCQEHEYRLRAVERQLTRHEG